MYAEELEIVAQSAKKKAKLFEAGRWKYYCASMLGGLYACFGAILAYTIGAVFHDANSPYGKIAMGLSFGIALCLISFAGAELFTSNTFVMTVGLEKKKTSFKDFLKITSASWTFNFVGSIIAALLFVMAGVISTSTGEYLTHIIEAKISYSPMELIIRGMLCNTMVCLATWCTYKMKNEAAKVIMLLWCVLTYMIAGFEHSIANMGIMSMVYFWQKTTIITLSGILYNLFFVTIGNIIGGAVVIGLGYTYISRNKE